MPHHGLQLVNRQQRGDQLVGHLLAEPFGKEIFLTEPSSNSVLAWTKANLREAEREGLEHLEHPEAFTSTIAAPAAAAPANSSTNSGKDKAPAPAGGAAANGSSAVVVAAGEGGKKGAKGKSAGGGGGGGGGEVLGQEVDLVFAAPKAATYNLTLIVMSDCWLGADEALQLKLRVAPLTRAAAEGRDLALNRAANRRLGAPDSSDSEAEDDDGSDGSGSSSGSGSDSDDDYDSEETGEEESEAGSDSGSATDSD